MCVFYLVSVKRTHPSSERTIEGASALDGGANLSGAQFYEQLFEPHLFTHQRNTTYVVATITVTRKQVTKNFKRQSSM